MKENAITIRRVGADRAGDIRLPNEPFPLRGRLRVRYADGVFSWAAETWPEDRVTYQTFPEEDYEKPWNRWLYLSDLKVCREVRRMGAARRLLEEGMAIAREEGYQGVSTIFQDNNLNAALFYLRTGFQIGGLDTRAYDGTKQAGKSDILLYRPL